ncbi:MAG: hypothetical protein HC924_16745 [Synechococcaceae cyanobacterium SM2_3_2]|nr:hypothetical protein [Synechococcaceae cyanobacterium SM2_3_2]
MSSKELDLKKTGIKILTLKAAKGLEFPIVAIAGFSHSTFPHIPKGTSGTATQEILTCERRTLFVGMTRAMRALQIPNYNSCCAPSPVPTLPGLMIKSPNFKILCKDWIPTKALPKPPSPTVAAPLPVLRPDSTSSSKTPKPSKPFAS